MANTPDEYQKQLEEYERQQAQYERNMAAWQKIYGGQDKASETPPPISGFGQIFQQDSQQNYSQQNGQQTVNNQQFLSDKKRFKIPKNIILPVGILVLILILLIGALNGGGQVSISRSSSRSSKAVQSKSSSSSASSVMSSGMGIDKDKASIDRIPAPGGSESLGNLMELYNQVIFPSALSVPEPEPVVDKTTINLGGSYMFRPNKNWASRIEGNSITLVHDEGIVAKFIFSKNKNPLKPDAIRDKVFPEFLRGFGIKDAVYEEIFYNTTLSGLSTTVTGRFNDQPLVLKFGMLNCNREILTYVIGYYQTDDIYPEEITRSLLNTITWKSNPVTFAE